MAQNLLRYQWEKANLHISHGKMLIHVQARLAHQKGQNQRYLHTVVHPLPTSVNWGNSDWLREHHQMQELDLLQRLFLATAWICLGGQLYRIYVGGRHGDPSGGRDDENGPSSRHSDARRGLFPN